MDALGALDVSGEFGEGGSDALGGLTQVLVAGGVAQADVAWAAEGAAGHGSNVSLVEQVKGVNYLFKFNLMILKYPKNKCK